MTTKQIKDKIKYYTNIKDTTIDEVERESAEFSIIALYKILDSHKNDKNSVG